MESHLFPVELLSEHEPKAAVNPALYTHFSSVKLQFLSFEAPTPGDIDQAAQTYPHAFRTRWPIVLSVQVTP